MGKRKTVSDDGGCTMSEKKRVSVDLGELCAVFEDTSIDHNYYLGLLTGEVIFISDDFMDAEERAKLEEKMEEGFGERYIPIPNTSSEEGYDDMEKFIETVEDAHLREKLHIAINGSGAFRRFKDVLLNYPKVRGRWFEFKDGRVEERVFEWFEIEGIELVDSKTR